VVGVVDCGGEAAGKGRSGVVESGGKSGAGEQEQCRLIVPPLCWGG
nr:hypothetical protein [Tanacetum cinerariifolium]